MRKLAWGLATLVLAASAMAQPYGPGMMSGGGSGMGGGWGSGGHGPGMMGGWGGGGHGPGMMGGGDSGWGSGAYADLDLSKEQRDKIVDIQSQVRRQEWGLMRGMHEQGWRMTDAWRDGILNEQEARKVFDAMTAQRKAMFELMIDAQKRIDAVLTPAQREQLKRRSGSR